MKRPRTAYGRYESWQKVHGPQSWSLRFDPVSVLKKDKHENRPMTYPIGTTSVHPGEYFVADEDAMGFFEQEPKNARKKNSIGYIRVSPFSSFLLSFRTTDYTKKFVPFREKVWKKARLVIMFFIRTVFPFPTVCFFGGGCNQIFNPHIHTSITHFKSQ